ncbi:alpha-glucosidase [Halorhabdus sp. CBA1104]|uniref:glycoside hydrolase family 13 protein n=1 Tax=Halorhabdus sp. CBA1104 TaxID=1380432 RepID=UPI0012B3403E|nr:alpha-glucosidase [Halorhabdus sp. CBA1104]QGN08006.1 alpha-glucosidase [Halorhabdus sp. CBA1104]
MSNPNEPADGADGSTEQPRAWWKRADIYQIYPRSFNDSDGDGIGDIPGMIENVPYLDELGVDAVWLSPVYASPQADNGYDISDYRAIDDQYGELADWEELLAALHDRDMRLIMDLVVNHTSDEHEWFQRSRAGEEPYDEFYYWREGDPAEPPNNWDSFFGGSAWSYDETREAWYLHLFDEKQPDLNWRNPAVREAVYEMMRWWLQKGIDGFRMDVINLLSKPEGLPDGDPDGGLTGAEHFMNGPKIHDYLSEMMAETVETVDREIMTVGETPGVSVEDAQEFVGEDGDGLSMVFQFEHVSVGDGDSKWEAGEWHLPAFKEIIERWQTGLAEDGWNSIYLSNHDQPRMVSRFGDDDQYRRKSAKLLGTFTHTLQGTPFVYQGEELGMTNTPFESIEELRDVEAINFVEEAIATGDAESYADVRDAIEAVSRDTARTPMQWTDGTHAGFTDGDPWIKLNPNYTSVNAERERTDPASVWQYYQDLIALREERDVLVFGDFELHYPDHPSVFAYTRTLGDERGLIVLNWSGESRSIDVPDHVDPGLELAIANDDAPQTLGTTLELSPWEARVYLTG